MFDNLVTVAAIAIFLWIGLFILYLVSSRQQRKIEQELTTLEKMLQNDEQQHDA